MPSLRPPIQKKPVTGASDDDHACPRFPPDLIEEIANFMAHGHVEHIAVVWTIQRDSADRTFLVV